MAKDYSYLEGKEFDVDTGKRIFRSKVIYADYHIGITCVEVSNSNSYVLCLVGPLDPNHKPIPKKSYKYIWQSIVSQIERGYLNATKTLGVYEKYTKSSRIMCSDPSSKTCAFGQ